MAHDRATRTKVRNAYVQGMALTSAAASQGVPYATARQWKRADGESGHDWDLLKQARAMSRSGVEEMAQLVLAELAEQFTATLAALKEDADMPAVTRSQILTQLMDGYSKAMSASHRAMPNGNRLAGAMDVIRFLTARFAAQHPKLHTAFVDAVEGMGPDLVREFGPQGGA